MLSEAKDQSSPRLTGSHKSWTILTSRVRLHARGCAALNTEPRRHIDECPRGAKSLRHWSFVISHFGAACSLAATVADLLVDPLPALRYHPDHVVDPRAVLARFVYLFYLLLCRAFRVRHARFHHRLQGRVREGE